MADSGGDAPARPEPELSLHPVVVALVVCSRRLLHPLNERRGGPRGTASILGRT
jgi:hypothetical protein